jgi:hypothetical protein
MPLTLDQALQKATKRRGISQEEITVLELDGQCQTRDIRVSGPSLSDQCQTDNFEF